MKYATRAVLIPMVSGVVLLTAGCGDGNDGINGGSIVSFDAQAVVANEADNVITQTYEDLNDAAAGLLAAVQALSDSGATDGELDAAQAAWKAARVPWEASEGFLFGPVDSAGIDPAVDSWPLDTQGLKDFLAANASATQGDVENATDDVRGFHAIEWLLFGLDDDGVTNNDMTAAALNSDDAVGTSAAKLNYLVALTQAFKAKTQLLEDSWTTDFNSQGPYAATFKARTQSAAMEELLNGIIGIVDEVGNAKIAEPMGSSIGEADTTLVESQYSWNSLTDFHDDIQSVLNVYTGKLGYDPNVDSISDTLNGLYAFVLAHDSQLADRVLDEIIDAQQKIALIKGDGNPDTTEITGAAEPFRNQIGTAAGRVLAQDAVDALNTLLSTLQNDVQPLLAQTDFAG